MKTTLRKTFKYKLKPTPQQERELEGALGLCCRLYNVALEHRKTAYERCHVSISRYEQEAELKEIRAELKPGLWAGARPRRECGQEHRMGRAGPSGRRGGGCVGEPRIRRALARAECQDMARRIRLEPHLSESELELRYRQAKV